MGGCCGGDIERDETVNDPTKVAGTRESRAALLAGPLANRRCTDSLWLFIFAVYLAVFGSGSLVIWGLSNIDRLMHGRDHTGAMCGLGERREQRYTYYPDLQTDFEKDQTLKDRYGICVEKCPAAGTTLPDVHPEGRRNDVWYVPLPSFPIAYRCVPMQNKTQLDGMKFCAYPECDNIGGAVPSNHKQVCGLHEDGTSRYWLLRPADMFLRWGWDEELKSLVPDSATRQAVIAERIRIAQESANNNDVQKDCKVTVRRETTVVIDDAEQGHGLKLMTQYSGLVYRKAVTISENRGLILGLGLGGSVVMSFLVICLFSFFVRTVLIVMMGLSFVVLAIVDYILFVQAHVATGNTARMVSAALENATQLGIGEVARPILEAQENEQTRSMYFGLAIALAMVIVLLICAACATQRNFAMLVGLVKEASRTVREMPSLLVFPMFGCISIFASSYFLLHTVLGVLTLEPKRLEPWIALVGADPNDQKSFDNAQFGLMWLVVFSFLWIYFFHVAIFIATVAGAVAQWFFRKEPGGGPGAGIHHEGWFFGRPVLSSLGRALRYHIGSLALGSLVMAIATLPRLILEYVDQQTKGQQEQNPVLQAAIRAARCCLCCLEQCLRFLTDYAYINVAVSGKPFCKAAHDSVILFAKYPVQVTMDKMVCVTLKVIACAIVPGICVVLAFVFTEDKTDWLVCAVVIAGLSFMVTRLAVGVYDVCVTTLFVCVMRDVEYHDGQYMTEELSAACGLPKKRSHDTEIELIQ